MAAKTAPKLMNYDDLLQEVRDVMDRAVRRAREQYWCNTFEKFAPEIFGVSKTHVVDSDGLSCRGRDKDGFSKDGYDEEGFDREGRDRIGYDREGFNSEGFNRRGLNKYGFDKQGRDMYRYDIYGYDQDGYDETGRRRRASRDWYTTQAAKPETDFCHDGYGQSRPKETPKKSVTGKNSDKLSS